MVGEKVEFLSPEGVFLSGAIDQISGEQVVVKDESGQLWQGSLSQLIFQNGQLDTSAACSGIEHLRSQCE